MATKVQEADLSEAVRLAFGEHATKDVVKHAEIRTYGPQTNFIEHRFTVGYFHRPEPTTEMGIDLAYSSPNIDLIFWAKGQDPRVIKEEIDILAAFESWRKLLEKRGYKTPDQKTLRELPSGLYTRLGPEYSHITGSLSYKLESINISSQSKLNRLVKDVKEVLEGGK